MNAIARPLNQTRLLYGPLNYLQRGAYRAGANNCRINPVMASPPTITLAPRWQATTAYAAGGFVATVQGTQPNAKVFFYSTVAGGTSGSGSGPQTTTPSADGSITWVYIGQYSSGLTNQASVNGFLWGAGSGLAGTSGVVKFLDGIPTNDGTTLYCKMFKNTTSGAAAYGASRWEFNTDASNPVIRGFAVTANSAFRVIVDGQYASLTPVNTPKANWFYMLIAFGSRPTRPAGLRNIVIESMTNAQFGGIDVGITEGVYPTGGDPPLTAVIAGDSHSASAGATYFYDGYWPIVCDRLGVRCNASTAIGGTGLLVVTASGTARSRLSDVTAQVAQFPNCFILEANGFNDADAFSGAQIQAEELLYLQAIRAACPTTPIIVTGIFPASKGGTPSASTWTGGLAAEAAKLAAVVAMNDPNIHFIPYLSNTAFFNLQSVTIPGNPAVFGTGNDVTPTGDGNADIYENGSSVPHMNDAGHAMFGHYVADLMRRVVLNAGNF